MCHLGLNAKVIVVALVVVIMMVNMMVMKVMVMVMVMVCQLTEYNTFQTLGMICKWTSAFSWCRSLTSGPIEIITFILSPLANVIFKVAGEFVNL
jgi:hypothetical protein